MADFTFADCARLLGSVRSERKAEAARRNGRLGGRPRKKTQAEKVGSQSYKVVASPAQARALKKGTPYVVREAGKPDRYMIR